mgnify:CR=1 FL=1
MKKSLLLFVSVMLTTLSAMALPTKPVISPSQYTPWAAEATGYLYNVEAGLFLTNGNWWGTHACGADNGSKSSSNYTSYEDILLGNAKVSGNKFVINEEDSRLLADSVTTVECFSLQNTKYGEGKHLFCGGNLDDLWVDGGSGDNFKQWYVETNADNSFKLMFVNKGTFGFQKISENNHNAFLDTIDVTTNTTWALVSEEVYNSVVDGFNLYYVSNKLNELVTAAKAQGIAKDFSEYDALLAEDTTTYAQYAAASQTLYPVVTLGDSINAAKALDAAHDWSSFAAIYADDSATVAVVDSALTNLKAYISLKKKLDAAIAEYSTVDFSAPQAVYDATGKTNAELAAAEALIDKLIVDYTSSLATVENPADITSQISGIDGSSITNWKRVFIGSGSTGSLSCNTWSIEATEDGMVTPFIENWVAAGGTLSDQKVYRDTISVRPGAYKITAKARLFNESAGAEYLAGANIFANLNRKSITKEGVEGQDNAIEGAKYATYNSKLYYYKDDFEGYGIVTGDSVLIFGMYIKDANCNWLAHKNYKVYYLGDSYESLDYVRQNSSLLADAYAEGTVGQTSLIAEYNAAVNDYKTSSTSVAISEGYAKINELQDSVVGNVAAYKSYTDRLAYIREYMADDEKGATLEGEYVDLLSDYIMDGMAETPSDAYPNGTADYVLEQLALSTTEIKAEEAFLDTLFANAVKYGLGDGSDLTDLIVNPGFELSGGTGWSLDTHGGACTSSLTNWHGGNATNYCAEAYQQKFDVYQTVEGVPNGLYEVSVQAFFRTDANATAYDAYLNDPEMTGDAKVYSYVYFNDFASPVKNVMEIQFTEDLGSNCYKAAEGVYTLNGMTSASTAFSLEDESQNFTQKVYGLVTDGKIRLGIRNLDTNASNTWTLWDNFKLKYRAKNEDALNSVLESLIGTYQSYVEQNADDLTALEKDAADTAIEEADAAVGQDGDTMYDALVALNAAYVKTQANVAAVKALKTAVDELNDVVNNYAETAREEDLNAGTEIAAEADDINNLETSEIESLTARIYEVIDAIKYPRFDLAAEDNPVDATPLIVNNGFEKGSLDGWSNSGSINAQAQSNTSFDNKQGTYYAERWHVNGTINLYQTIKNLPAGKYELKAYVYSDADDAVLYANDQEVSVSTSMLYTVTPINLYEDGDSITIGVKWTDSNSSKWLCADEFTLTYYGIDATFIEDVDVAKAASEIVAIYSASGAQIPTLQKGINIVKYADGSIKKIFVK